MFDIKPEYQRLLEISGFCWLVAFIVTLFRTVITENHGGLKPFFVDLASSVLVAVLVGWSIEDTGIGFVTKCAIVAFCAFISKDILLVIKKFRESFVADPKAFIKDTLDTWRGR